MPKEIERKWLLDTIELNQYALISEHKVEQAYVSADPEVRIRNQDDAIYTLTLKDNGSVSRTEVEINITGDQYGEICTQLIQKPPIRKLYRKYRLPDGLILEASRVDDGVFCYAEVEFPSMECALAFQPLPEFQRELSEGGFRMRDYWQQRDGFSTDRLR